MLPSTSSRLRQGPTHVTDTGRCPTPCPNPTEVAQLGQLSLCCSRSGASPSSQACSVLSPALQLSRAAVCTATELSVCCSQDPSDLRTFSVLRPDWRGEPVVTDVYVLPSIQWWIWCWPDCIHRFRLGIRPYLSPLADRFLPEACGWLDQLDFSCAEDYCILAHRS